VELERDGLPIDRQAAEQLITASAGPRPTDEADARRIRADRDAAVLAHTPGRGSTDLRNPVQVRELLASVGVVVPNTRKWVLEPFRDTHPVVGALLEWRKAERIATTYGHHWLDTHVGPDDRLRGGWSACDGAAGRMTAQNGLHNLPTALRPAVAAHPGHVLVRADLGQIEPRVLAVVAGDAAFAAATRADDLYAPVAATLGVERPVAKVAVLAAMYGQRSGAAGEALKGLERAYPVAMGYLDRAYASGLRREPLRTYGGRLIRLDTVLADVPAEGAAAYDAARGRFARNAVIQGSAAELFKAWAATVRATTRDLGAQIVLCLHDELLVHVPQEHAQETMRRVATALDDSARRWTGSTQVRFVADASVIHRWSEAKD
jgi:DNA polymerase-1